jgi:hypothetical protein
MKELTDSTRVYHAHNKLSDAWHSIRGWPCSMRMDSMCYLDGVWVIGLARLTAASPRIAQWGELIGLTHPLLIRSTGQSCVVFGCLQTVTACTSLCRVSGSCCSLATMPSRV